MKKTDIIRDKMLEYYASDPMRIQHFIKVESFASIIAEREKVDEETATVISILGYVHDIGIKIAEEKYGRSTGKLQEELGEIPAKDMVLSCGFAKEIADRVSYVTSHHHTYTMIDNMEYQVLVEADFLVNIFEDEMDRAKAISIRDKIFKTKSGTDLINQMYGI